MHVQLIKEQELCAKESCFSYLFSYFLSISNASTEKNIGPPECGNLRNWQPRNQYSADGFCFMSLPIHILQRKIGKYKIRKANNCLWFFSCVRFVRGWLKLRALAVGFVTSPAYFRSQYLLLKKKDWSKPSIKKQTNLFLFF